MARKSIKQMTLEMLAAATCCGQRNDDKWIDAYYVAENIGRCYYRLGIEMKYNDYKEGNKTAYEILNDFRRELWSRKYSAVCALVSASIDRVINA